MAEFYNMNVSVNIECVCEDCGINVPFELQYGVRMDNGDYKIVCEECIKKYSKNKRQILLT